MKKRLDLIMVEKGIVSARSKAERLIKEGQVTVNGEKAVKPGMTVDEDAVININEDMIKYVSRGGLKLERAVAQFGLELRGCVCMDVGASTGGFTDCMLQNGAVKVYAVDVGSGQLNEKLLADERVINLENTNARYMDETVIPEKVDFVSIDVSFISLKLILPAVTARIKETGSAVCLIKPQFEAGRENLNKHGVVKDKKVHAEVINSVCGFVESIGWCVIGLDHSPIKGPEGNIEYLVRITSKQNVSAEKYTFSPAETVEKAHAELDK
ncbi:MAG: TlyA family RNA methyltransferase [Oscillospiraceae bacterium]|nr:TlyA family RNA methyltransferase [Oscillospiraceae bacterium]MBQ9939287.1 TlyA family RNA methyltransferase [Oscillospiraceae bacterium]